MRGSAAVREILSRQIVVRRHDQPQLGSTLSRLHARGELEVVLPGVYAAAPAGWRARVAAALIVDPDAIICGRAAAALTFWPTLPVSTVEVAGTRHPDHHPGYLFSRRMVPVDLIAGGRLRLTSPALTAVDLCTSELGAESIDVVLRERAARIHDLCAALAATPGRRGNAERARLLLESRAEPWSAAERAAHRLLRRAGITGWVANHPIKIRSGEQISVYYLDICFRRERLVIEIDGRRHHTSPSAFESDRSRQNDLQLMGWRILRFTWAMIIDRPDYVLATIRAALR